MRNLPADLSGPDKTHMCVRIWRGVSSVGEAKSLVEKSAYRTSGLKNVPVGFTSARWAFERSRFAADAFACRLPAVVVLAR